MAEIRGNKISLEYESENEKRDRGKVDFELLDTFDASAEQFLNDLPTPEKYSILGMALVVWGEYEDFEEAVYQSERKVSAQDLTKHLLELHKSKFLSYRLQDALRLGWEHVECFQIDEDPESETEDE